MLIGKIRKPKLAYRAGTLQIFCRSLSEGNEENITGLKEENPT